MNIQSLEFSGVRHILFDLDNTLWDHQKNAQLNLRDRFDQARLRQRFGLDFEAFYLHFERINEDLWRRMRDKEIDRDYLRGHRFRDLLGYFGIDDPALASDLETNFLKEMLDFNQLVSGSLEVLEYLKKKRYILHIVSNGFSEITFRKLEGSGIRDFFYSVTTACDSRAFKPSEEMFRFALQRAKATREDALLIGDDPVADVGGAYEFGLPVIWFNPLGENLSYKVSEIRSLLELKTIL